MTTTNLLKQLHPRHLSSPTSTSLKQKSTEAAEELAAAIEAHRSIGNWACLAHTFEGVSVYLVAEGRELDAARVVGGVDNLRLNISTILAPYERFLVDHAALADSIDSRPDLEAAREEGRAWDRDELRARSLEVLAV